MAHEYYQVSPEVAMNWRRGGDNVRTIMTREYRGRHRDGDRRYDDRSDRRKDKHNDKRHNDDRDDRYNDHRRD
jgi:hypothetical protein